MNGFVKKALVSLVILVLLAGIYPAWIVVAAAGNGQTNTNVAAQLQMLQATVHITMFAPGPDQDDVAAADGLGTLAISQGQMVILTHNHWGEVYQQLSAVELRSAADGWRTQLSGATFKQLVQHQDAGTLMVQAPPELVAFLSRKGLSLPSLNEAQGIRSGDRVLIVHRHPDDWAQAEIVEAVAVYQGHREGLPIVALFDRQGAPIVYGDSGGGVWLDGRLVGNMWITMAEPFGGTPTGLSVTAKIPAGLQGHEAGVVVDQTDAQENVAQPAAAPDPQLQEAQPVLPLQQKLGVG